MPLYFFEVEGPFAFSDRQGEPYRSLREARAGAVKFLSTLLMDRCAQICPGERWCKRVRDEEAETMCELTFMAA